ncbi:MotA/TolQ/ExbB proton channel family protein [Deltaproteobacteria bacterium TL4]
MESAFVQAFFTAGPLGLTVLIVLFMVSVWIWGVGISKYRELLRKRKENRYFLELLESEPDLSHFRDKLGSIPDSALKHMYIAGEKEIHEFFQQHPATGYRVRLELLEMLERLFESIIVHEEKTMGHGQNLMATVSVVAPFIGLFGTVVGIINTFHSIAALKSVELTVIAPGISEALVATAAGLLTAIPSSVGFNLFRAMIREMLETMEYCSLHLLKRLQLQLMILDEKET